MLKMDEKTRKVLVNDLKNLAIGFLILFVFLRLHYSKENLIVLIKVALAHFMFFIIPGYAMMLDYVDSLDFFERFAIGLGIGYGLQPMILYLINVVIKVNVLAYSEFISGLMVVIGLSLFYFKKKVD